MKERKCVLDQQRLRLTGLARSVARRLALPKRRAFSAEPTFPPVRQYRACRGFTVRPALLEFLRLPVRLAPLACRRRQALINASKAGCMRKTQGFLMQLHFKAFEVYVQRAIFCADDLASLDYGFTSTCVFEIVLFANAQLLVVFFASNDSRRFGSVARSAIADLSYLRFCVVGLRMTPLWWSDSKSTWLRSVTCESSLLLMGKCWRSQLKFMVSYSCWQIGGGAYGLWQKSDSGIKVHKGFFLANSSRSSLVM